MEKHYFFILRRTDITLKLPTIVFFLFFVLFCFSVSLFSQGKKPPKNAEEPEKEERIDESADQISSQSADEQPESSVTETSETSQKETEEETQEKDQKSPAPSQETVKEQVQPVEPEKTVTPSAPEKIAEEPPTAIPAGSQIHTVWIWQESRECLWRLAKKYYGDPWKWKKIFLANRNSILDPNIIYPKQQIVIPPKEENRHESPATITR